MPHIPSPYSSVASGQSGQADPLDPRLIQLAMQAVPGMGALQGPSPVPPSRQITPPIDLMSTQGGPPSYGALPLQQGQGDVPDRLQQFIAFLSGNGFQLKPDILMLLAGVGANVLFENMGKPPMSKPHRSNQELSQQGYDTGNPNQIQTQDPAMMQRALQVQVPRG